MTCASPCTAQLQETQLEKNQQKFLYFADDLAKFPCNVYSNILVAKYKFWLMIVTVSAYFVMMHESRGGSNVHPQSMF